MHQRCEVIVIGAGTAGLSALQKVRKQTDDFLLINAGPGGTTCARTGCMPSKVLIDTANALAQAKRLGDYGVRGAGDLRADTATVLERVRSLRDHYVDSVLESTDSLAQRTIHGKARVLGPDTVEVNGERYQAARAIVIATGSRPVVDPDWEVPGERILTSDNLFEQPSLPPRMAVLGLGAQGVELAQALARLGIEVHGFEASESIGGLTDPKVNEAAIATLGEEFDLHTGSRAQLRASGDGVHVETETHDVEVDKVLAALGRRPNLDLLGLESLGIETDEHGLPPFDPATMQIADLPVFIAGDVNQARPVLHEAADEGFIAGCNATRKAIKRFERRTPFTVCFTEPNIVLAGASFDSLKGSHALIAGEADFEGQGRAMMTGRDRGRLRLYADAESKRVLGTEMCIPDGEHIGHLTAWAIQQRLTVQDLLSLPYYHPTLEEELRSALRAINRQLEARRPTDFELCIELPYRGLD